MKTYDLTPNLARVGDFLGWMREGTLDLNPPFQRRSVWNAAAKSYLIDTIYRGLPVPLVYLRERIDLQSQTVRREVVDGQQRLRTLLAYIEPSVLSDYVEAKDHFEVLRRHNALIGGKSWKELDPNAQTRILGYRFSIQILPSEMEDREILQVFARLNSTGLRVNRQELRNAKYFGEFKTLMYDLGYEHFEQWLGWGVLTEDQLSRMLEVELASDLFVNMIYGLSSKSQPRLDRVYQEFDETFPGAQEYTRRFRQVMDAIQDTTGAWIAGSVFHNEIHFFVLFVFMYDRMFGLGSPAKRKAAIKLPASLGKRLQAVSQRYENLDLPKEVVDSITGASSDFGRRQTRLQFLADICDGKAR